MNPFRRLLPSPWWSLGLLLLWLVLSRSVSAGHVLLGALIALVIPPLVAPLGPGDGRLQRPLVIVRFLARVTFDVVLSNLEVARDVLGAWRRPTPKFVVIPLDLRNAAGLATLAWVTTIVPGTVWSELAADRSAMLLHVWDVRDEAAFVARFKARYERPLQEIFE